MEGTKDVNGGGKASSLADFVKFAKTTLIALVITQGVACMASNKIVFPFLDSSADSNEASNYFILNKIALFTIALQWVVYIVHGSGLIFGNKKTEKFYDLTGSLTFISSIAICFFYRGGRGMLSHRQKLLCCVVLFWAVRLGLFLFSRISNHPGQIDDRFNKVRERLFLFWNFWTIQGVWVFLTALPVFMANELEAKDTMKHVTNTEMFGFLLWFIGFFFELIADIEKLKFNSKNNANRKMFISTGLWKFSRHPNYFGEILLWFGVAIVSCVHMTSFRQKLVCFLSPVFVAFLLINVSGIPLLEKKGLEKWKDNSDYANYVRDTPVLIPFIGRRGNAAF
jgi:steroid 5-alpha reductase family enzyme